jgi:ribosome maturation factor RimP
MRHAALPRRRTSDGHGSESGHEPKELIDLNRRIVQRLRLIRSARQLVDLAGFSVGMRVEFTTDDGRTLEGQITRLNRETATVCCDPSGHWRVSPALLRPIVDHQTFRLPTGRLVPISANRTPR